MKRQGRSSRHCSIEALESRQLLSTVLPATPATVTALSAVPSHHSGAVLHPGTGGSVPIPSGTNTGTGTLAIANSDAVPYQTFSGQLDVGVVAFHSSGIKEVLYSVNGGAWISVTTTSVDPQTGANEYWVTLNAYSFADGAVTVQAVAIPNNGRAKVLNPITFYANYHGSLKSNIVYVSNSGSDRNAGSQSSPFQTLQMALSKVGDGGNIILEKAGIYEMGVVPNTQTQNLNNLRWINIEAGSGLAADQITIEANDDRIITRVQRLELTGLTLDFGHINSLYAVDLWLDHITMTMSVITTADPAYPYRSMGGAADVYATDSIAIHTIYGFVNCTLVRNCDVSQITGDAYQNSQTMINNTVHEFYGTNVHHADIYQMWGDKDNVIIYGMKSWDISGAQGIFLQPTYSSTGTSYSMTNSAFVDVNLSVNDTNGLANAPYSQMMSNFNNILFLRFNSPDQQIIFRTTFTGSQTWNGKNIVFEDCVFNPRNVIDGIPGVVAIGCTFGVPLNPDWVPSLALIAQANI